MTNTNYLLWVLNPTPYVSFVTFVSSFENKVRLVQEILTLAAPARGRGKDKFRLVSYGSRVPSPIPMGKG